MSVAAGTGRGDVRVGEVVQYEGIEPVTVAALRVV
jgi:hypothetical protein